MRKRALTYALRGPLPQAMGYIAGPIALSRRGRRRGWRGRKPGPLNLTGAAPLATGAAFLGAAIVAHYHDSPEEMASSLIPNYLVRSGVYGVTRNPMYVGGSLMLAGWAVFFGSARLAAVCGVYVCGMNFGGIPFEERLLHRKFGASYDDYCRSVPRWL
jgi:protein-S-isoprenylcysteine O-methyltransferase Ste14